VGEDCVCGLSAIASIDLDYDEITQRGTTTQEAELFLAWESGRFPERGGPQEVTRKE
jgi:hypothetical protein